MRVWFLLSSVILLVLLGGLFPIQGAASQQLGLDSLRNPISNPNCPLGMYCANGGVARACPAGTYGDANGLSDDSCSGSCSLMWNSPPGSLSCYNFSTVGSSIIGIIVCVIVAVVTAGTYFIRSKATEFHWLQRLGILPEPAADADEGIEADVRAIRQRQIRAGVDALAARIVKQSFPSVLALSSSLMQFNLVSAGQVNSGIKQAQKELAEHIKELLLQHPRLRFDDETYPAKLPLWAEVDPTSEDGAQEIHSASNTIAFAIRTAVENDVLDWFRRQQGGEETGLEEPQEGLLSNASARGVASQWPSVDSELKIALRTALADSSWCKCFSGSRLAYSQLPKQPLVIDAVGTFFQLSLDILVLVACFLCFRGDALVNVEVPFDRVDNPWALTKACDISINYYYALQSTNYYPYRIAISWNDITKPRASDPFAWSPWKDPGVDCGFTFTRDGQTYRENVLFEPILDQCAGIFGETYRNLLVFTCVSFWIVMLPCFVGFCNTCMRLTESGRGLSESLKSFLPTVPPIFNPRVDAWLVREGGVLSMIRFFGTLGMIAAVGMYSSACIARLNNAPALISNHPISNGSSRLVYSVVMQPAYILSIVAASFALITAALPMQKAFRAFRNSGNNPAAVVNAHVEMHNMVRRPAAASAHDGIHSVSAVPIHALEAIRKDHAVTIHTHAGPEIPVSVAAYPVMENETNVSANLNPDLEAQQVSTTAAATSSSSAVSSLSPEAPEITSAEAVLLEGITSSSEQDSTLSREQP